MNQIEDKKILLIWLKIFEIIEYLYLYYHAWQVIPQSTYAIVSHIPWSPKAYFHHAIL